MDMKKTLVALLIGLAGAVGCESNSQHNLQQGILQLPSECVKPLSLSQYRGSSNQEFQLLCEDATKKAVYFTLLPGYECDSAGQKIVLVLGTGLN